MNQISTYLAISLMIVAGLVGVGVGYALTPQYSLSMYEKGSAMDLGIADKNLDLRYINAMAAHHRGAMLLGEQANASQRPEIKDLAATIQEGEPVLIDQLYSWKKDWYQDDSKAKDPIVAKLGAYDEKFDLRFLNALIAHHEAGIQMTKEVRTKSSRSEILNDADAVEAFLSKGLEMLKGWRMEWYGV